MSDNTDRKTRGHDGDCRAFEVIPLPLPLKTFGSVDSSLASTLYQENHT
jgi:hypothetical protein